MACRTSLISAVLILLALSAASALAAEDVAELWRSQLGSPYCAAADATDGSVWMGMGNSVVHLAQDGAVLVQCEGFLFPSGIAVNPNDRSVWVTDTGHDQVVHLSMTGGELLRIDGFSHPRAPSVNPTDGSVWVGDRLRGEIVHLNAAGGTLSRTGGFSSDEAPSGTQFVAVDPSDGSCLVADGRNNRLVCLRADGSQAWELATQSAPLAVAVNPSDGSFWATGAHFDEVSHFSKDGIELWHGTGDSYFLNQPLSLSVGANDTVWVSGQCGTVRHLGEDGTLLGDHVGLNAVVAANPTDGSCWAASWHELQVVRLGADDTEQYHLDLPPLPSHPAVNEAEGSCWVTRNDGESGGELERYATDGTREWHGGWYYATALAVNQQNGSVWEADQSGSITHLAADGTTTLWSGSGYYSVYDLSLDPRDGSLWVAQPVSVSHVTHLSAEGDKLFQTTVGGATAVAVDPGDGSVWVGADYALSHLAADGSVLWSTGNLMYSTHLVVDPRDHSVWVGGGIGRQLTHVAADGTQLGVWYLRHIDSLAIDWVNGTVWMTDNTPRLLHLATTGEVLWEGLGYGGQVAVDARHRRVWLAQSSQDQLAQLEIPWFSDLARHSWGADSIGACAVAGLVTGYAYDNTYRPKNTVNRGQMAAYIARALCGGEDLVPTGPATPTFSDVGPDKNFYDHVEYLTSHGVVTGYSDGTYHPEWFVNRGQMAAFLARATCGGEDYVPTGPATPSFADVAQDFKFYNHVEYIYSAGITTGKHDGLYHPEESCLRDQMAVFIGRAFLGL